jgi:hypothetical protein
MSVQIDNVTVGSVELAVGSVELAIPTPAILQLVIALIAAIIFVAIIKTLRMIRR